MSPLVPDNGGVSEYFTPEIIQGLLKQGTLVRELKKLYPSQRYDKKSKKFKIRFYETNKIRILLARYYNTGGYPVRFYNHVGYFSGIAQWIPDQWMIMPRLTRDGWKDFPHTQYSQVSVMKINIYDKLTDEVLARGTTGIVGMAPFVGGVVSGVISQIERDVMYSSIKWRPIYPNLLFYNTINDKIVWANWNLVLDDLNIIEKLKYLALEEDVSDPLFPTE